MYGAIIGDIAGSTLEFRGKKFYDFHIFIKGGDITDDTIMTIAVAQALMQWRQEDGDFHEAMCFHMLDLGRKHPYYPLGAHGSSFKSWLRSNSKLAYKSCGNGSAMRASPCGLIAASLDEALDWQRSLLRSRTTIQRASRAASPAALPGPITAARQGRNCRWTCGCFRSCQDHSCPMISFRRSLNLTGCAGTHIPTM